MTLEVFRRHVRVFWVSDICFVDLRVKVEPPQGKVLHETTGVIYPLFCLLKLSVKRSKTHFAWGVGKLLNRILIVQVLIFHFSCTRHCSFSVTGWSSKKHPTCEMLQHNNRRKLPWFGHVTCHKSLSKTILQGILEDGRRRCRQRKCWMDNIKKWTSLPVHELFTKVFCREDWERIFVESSLVSPRRSSPSRDWTELNRMNCTQHPWKWRIFAPLVAVTAGRSDRWGRRYEPSLSL